MNNWTNEPLEFVRDLTPELADSMGYEWWKDMIYDIEAPYEAMKDLYQLRDEGYFFGRCAGIGMEENNMIGVYKKKPTV